MNQKLVSEATSLQHDAVVLRRTVASAIINLSIEEVEDIQTGIEDGTYSASENRDIAAKKEAAERAELLYRESAGDVLTLPRDIASLLIDMARNRVNDIESGLADGTYEATQNTDFRTKLAAVDEAELQYRKLPEATSGDGANITSYCQQVCGGGECGTGSVCKYGVDPLTEMPAFGNHLGVAQEGLELSIAEHAGQMLATMNPPLRRIEAYFQPQAWVNDYATDVDGGQQVDVTDAVLRLDLEQIHALVDYRDSTDALVDAVELGHDGPFTVRLAASVQGFFGVQDLCDITHAQVIEARAMADYHGIFGKTVIVSAISGFVGNDSVDINLDPPAKVRVEKTMETSVRRWNDDWCDPCWEVVLVEPHPQLSVVRSMWISGTCYNLDGKRTEPSDVVSVVEETRDALSRGTAVTDVPAYRKPPCGDAVKSHGCLPPAVVTAAAVIAAYEAGSLVQGDTSILLYHLFADLYEFSAHEGVDLDAVWKHVRSDIDNGEIESPLWNARQHELRRNAPRYPGTRG